MQILQGRYSKAQLLRRPLARNSGGWSSEKSPRTWQQLIDAVSTDFWQKWNEIHVQTLIYITEVIGVQCNLELTSERYHANLRLKCSQKAEWLASIPEVFPSDDVIVRKVSVAYNNFKVSGRGSILRAAMTPLSLV